MGGNVLAVDLGGTKMRAAVVDSAGRVLTRLVEPTPHDPYPWALDRLIDTTRDRGGGRGTFESVVVGVPGRVDYKRGQLEYAPNLPPAWCETLSETALAGHFDAPVHLANDADLAAVGETYFGAAKGFDDVVYVTISTGVGAGVLLGRRLVHGTRSLAEVGHTVIALDRLTAGRSATVEQLAAGPALARYAQAEGIDAHGADLVAMVRAGDAAACNAWRRCVQVVSAVVVNLTHLFSPDVIVIGGGVGNNGRLILDPVEELLARHGPKHLAKPIVAVGSQLGDDPALRGAAAWHVAMPR